MFEKGVGKNFEYCCYKITQQNNIQTFGREYFLVDEYTFAKWIFFNFVLNYWILFYEEDISEDKTDREGILDYYYLWPVGDDEVMVCGGII